MGTEDSSNTEANVVTTEPMNGFNDDLEMTEPTDRSDTKSATHSEQEDVVDDRIDQQETTVKQEVGEGNEPLDNQEEGVQPNIAVKQQEEEDTHIAIKQEEIEQVPEADIKQEEVEPAFEENEAVSRITEESENVRAFITGNPNQVKLEQFSDDELEIMSQSSSDSSSSDSDSDSSSDADSDSESDSDDSDSVSNSDSELDAEKTNNKSKKGPINLDDEEGDFGDEGPIVSHNEVQDEKAPELPSDYILPENAPIEHIGEITGFVDKSIIIRANVSGEFRVLKEKSVICLEDRTILGLIFEVFGRLKSPSYRIKFNTDEDLLKFKSLKGAKVYYVVPDTQFVYTEEVKKHLKGTDASNWHDEELPAEEQEYSDDEQEAAAKSAKKKKKKNSNKKEEGSQTEATVEDGKRRHSFNHKEASGKRFQLYGYANPSPDYGNPTPVNNQTTREPLYKPRYLDNPVHRDTTSHPARAPQPSTAQQYQHSESMPSVYGVPFDPTKHTHSQQQQNMFQNQSQPIGNTYNPQAFNQPLHQYPPQQGYQQYPPQQEYQQFPPQQGYQQFQPQQPQNPLAVQGYVNTSNQNTTWNQQADFSHFPPEIQQQLSQLDPAQAQQLHTLLTRHQASQNQNQNQNQNNPNGQW